MLAEACTWPVNECDEVTTSLENFGRSWDALATAQPSFGLELPGIFSPKRLHPVDYEDGHCCLLPSRDDNVIRDVSVRKSDRGTEGHDIALDWLCEWHGRHYMLKRVACKNTNLGEQSLE
jgi:hypothetical protein